MTEFEGRPTRTFRRRLIGIVGGGVFLGLAGVVAGRALEPSTPALVENLAGPRDQLEAQFDRAVRQRFPIGSNEAAMVAELAREGFARRDVRSYRWQRVHGTCSETANVGWQADAGGRIVALDPHFLFFCT